MSPLPATRPTRRRFEERLSTPRRKTKAKNQFFANQGLTNDDDRLPREDLAYPMNSIRRASIDEPESENKNLSSHEMSRRHRKSFSSEPFNRRSRDAKQRSTYFADTYAYAVFGDDGKEEASDGNEARNADSQSEQLESYWREFWRSDSENDEENDVNNRHLGGESRYFKEHDQNVVFVDPASKNLAGNDVDKVDIVRHTSEHNNVSDQTPRNGTNNSTGRPSTHPSDWQPPQLGSKGPATL